MINALTHQEAMERCALPLHMKEFMAATRIREWYERYSGNVYVAFSGGKDSTVLLHLVRKYYPDVEAVFSNTGLEYPEIVDFVKSVKNTTIIKPKISFKKVIEKYGYPVISKSTSRGIYQIRNTKSEYLKNLRLFGSPKGGAGKVADKWQFLINSPFKIHDACCDKLKKDPFKVYEKQSGKKPIIGTMIEESRLRRQSYIQYGCNAFELTHPRSAPISYFTEDDIWQYIKKYNLEYCKIYDTGVRRTGCLFCMLGVQHENIYNNRFHMLEKSHPKLHNYCINKLGLGKVLDYIGVEYKSKQLDLFNE